MCLAPAQAFNNIDLSISTFSSGSTGRKVFGPVSSGAAGGAISSAGDLNHDGIDDYIIGVNNMNTVSGSAYLVFGKRSQPTTDLALNGFASSENGFRIYSSTGGDNCGSAVGAAGDMNGDNIDDVIVACRGMDPGSGGNGAGSVFVLFGHTNATAFPDIDLTGYSSGTTGLRIDGPAVSAALGQHCVSGVGDLNNDGFDEIAVSSAAATVSSRAGAGAIYVIFGKSGAYSNIAANSLSSGTTGFYIHGAAGGDNAGRAYGAAGDFNGDSYGDMVIGVAGGDYRSRVTAGMAYVLFGRSGKSTFPNIDLLTFTSSSSGFRIRGVGSTGCSVSGAGDVNSDGYDDILVGSNTAIGGAFATVIYGRNSSTPFYDVDLLTFTSGARGFKISYTGLTGFSTSVGITGDLNGDSVPDMVLSAPNAGYSTRSTSGWVVVVFGRTSSAAPFGDLDLAQMTSLGVDGEIGYQVFGGLAADTAGTAVSRAGDVNGDGLEDYLIGAPGGDPPSLAGAGFVYLIYGSTPVPTTNPTLAPTAKPTAAPTMTAAPTITSLPIVTASPTRSPTAMPSVVILTPTLAPTPSPTIVPTVRPTVLLDVTLDLASMSSTSTAKGFMMIGENDGEGFGSDVRSAGDHNGDGIADLLISVSSYSPLSRASGGIIYMLFGRTGITPSTYMDFLEFTSGWRGYKILGAAASDQAGNTVSGAGDINDDGKADIMIGAPASTALGRVAAGTVYVIMGRAGPYTDIDLLSLSSTKGFKVYGSAGGDKLGSLMSMLGDFNGDGKSDLLIAADYADPLGRTDAGITYVFFSNISSAATSFPNLDARNFTSGSRGLRILGASMAARMKSLSGAGDVNGDGFADIILGLPDANPTERSNAGLAFVFFGHSSNTPYVDIDTLSFTAGPTGFRIIGATSGSLCGAAVSGAGDFNDDGFADVIVGATAGAGAAYVLFGHTYTASFPDFDLQVIAGAATSAGFAMQGEQPSDGLGSQVATAGDVNGDGVDDLMIASTAATKMGRASSGAVYVLFGFSGWNANLAAYDLVKGSRGYMIFGAAVSAGAGTVLGSAGDISNDGLTDMFVTSLNGSPRTDSVVYILYGYILTPSSQPSTMPSGQPSTQPSSTPSVKPSSQPTRRPSSQPSSAPTSPSSQPTLQPSRQPTLQPSRQPTQQPTTQPTSQPSRAPSLQPSGQPTEQPTLQPTQQPTQQPTRQPTSQPSRAPSSQPSGQPTQQPTLQPSGRPTQQPSAQPTGQPTLQPSCSPSSQPTLQPSRQPTGGPSQNPSSQPTGQPTPQPTPQPSRQPTHSPTHLPSVAPSTDGPTPSPSASPSTIPTEVPTAVPTGQPSAVPTADPSACPSVLPSASPSATPTVFPTAVPTVGPSVCPSAYPSALPTPAPSVLPTFAPSPTPSASPTGAPTMPTAEPTTRPSVNLNILRSSSYAVRNGFAFAAIAADGTLTAWGETQYGGNYSAVYAQTRSGVVQVVASKFAFTALTTDGSLAAWGDSLNIRGFTDGIPANVTILVANEGAFAASNGTSLVAYGMPHSGGITPDLRQFGSVVQIAASGGAFAARSLAGVVCVWGHPSYGGAIPGAVASLLVNVRHVTATREAFAALRADGSVVTWGNPLVGGDSSAVSSQLQSGVLHIGASKTAFFAIKEETGALVVWGFGPYGGNASSVQQHLSSGIAFVTYTFAAMAALKNDGSVVTWGRANDGGDSSAVQSDLSDVRSIQASSKAFAAVTATGRVVAWGHAAYGGHIQASKVSPLSSGVLSIHSTNRAFAALKSDGSVVVWGQAGHGGEPGVAVEALLSSGVHTICSNDVAFSAIKTDGTVVAWGHAVSVPWEGIIKVDDGLRNFSKC